MSISTLFGKRERTFNFVLGDGLRLTPNEFGKLALKWSLEYGEQFIADYFEKGKPGWFLLGGSLIEEKPAAAHLYMSLLYVSTTYVFVDAVLKAPSNVSAQVRSAVYDGFTRLKVPPDEASPNQRMLDHLRGVSESMFAAIVNDMTNEAARNPEGFRPQPLEATEHLHTLLRNAYAWSDNQAPFLGHAPDQIHLAVKLQKAIDSAPLGLLVALNDQTKITLIEA